MNVLDVNVIVAMSRDDHAHYRRATEWFETSIAAAEPFSVPDFVAVGFVRVSTNATSFIEPSRAVDCFAYLDQLRGHPLHLGWITHPQTDGLFREIVTRSGTRGRKISDAYIAALAKSYGGTVVTFDRGFRQFDNVKTLELSAS